jgi:hypothetical protein
VARSRSGYFTRPFTQRKLLFAWGQQFFDNARLCKQLRKPGIYVAHIWPHFTVATDARNCQRHLHGFTVDAARPSLR